MAKIVFHDSDMIDRTVEVGADPVLIGRATECGIQTQDAMVSRRHARIVFDGSYWIEDLGSSNGVFVGGQRIAQPTPLRPDEEVRCGTIVLRLLADAAGRPRSSPAVGAPPPQAPPSYPPQQQAPPYAAPQYQPPPPYEPPQGYAPDAQARQRTTGQYTPPSATEELSAERSRRVQAENALLTAEQRASTAETKLGDAVNRAREAEQRAADLEARLTQIDTKEADKLRRRIEQLQSENRRLRGGAPEPEPVAGGGDPAAIAELTAERDRLKQRVADLTAETERLAAQPAAAPVPEGETNVLRRKVEQLMAEVRRLRSGQPAPAAGPGGTDLDNGKVAELEKRLAQAESERDEARRQASAAPPPAPVAGPEVEKLRRTVEQLQSENRRLRQGAPAAPDDARVADLTARLEKAEQDLAAARSAGGAPGLDPAGCDAVNQLSDLLSDLRGNVRAARDEAGFLGVEAPSDSVNVMRDELTSAGEKLDASREIVRSLKTKLGVR